MMVKIIRPNKTGHLFFLLQTVIALAGILALGGVGRADSISNHRISMTLRNQSMTDVFQKLSNVSGFEIVYNDALKNQRVTVHLENVTIENALHKILLHLNHTIVYEENKTIQIEVYGGGIPGSGSSGTSVARTIPRRATGNVSQQGVMPGQESGSPRVLSADEQYIEDERAAGNIP